MPLSHSKCILMMPKKKAQGGVKMEWQFVVALIVIVPIIFFPAIFVMYLNLGGLWAAIKEARQKRKAARDAAAELPTPERFAK